MEYIITSWSTALKKSILLANVANVSIVPSVFLSENVCFAPGQPLKLLELNFKIVQL